MYARSWVLFLSLSAGLSTNVRADEDPDGPTMWREYDLTGLLDPIETQEAPSLGLVRSAPARPSSGGFVFEDSDEQAERSWLSRDELERWVAGVTGRPAERRGRRLAVELSAAGHRKLAAALRAIQARARPVAAATVEVYVLPAGSAQALEDEVGAALSATGLEALQRARRAGGRVGATQLLLRDGERGALAHLERTSFVGDYELNATGVLPVLDPVIEQLCCGLSVELAVARLPGAGGRLLVDARVERAERAQALRELTLPQAGPMQLPSVSHLALTSSAVAETGETLLLGVFQVPEVPLSRVGGPAAGDAPPVLAVVCRLASVPAPAGAPQSELPTLRRYALRSFQRAPERRFTDPAWPQRLLERGDGDSPAGLACGGVLCFDDEDPDEGDDRWTAARLADQVMGQVAQGTWEDPDSGCWVDAREGDLIVSQTAAGHAALEAFLGETPAPPLLRYELLVLAAPETEACDPVAPLLDTPAWQALRAAYPVQARVLLCGQSGEEVSGLLRTERRLLAQVQRCATGTDSVVMTVEDPIVVTTARGIHLAVRGEAASDGSLSLALRADLRRGGRLELTEGASGGADRELDVDALRLERTFPLDAGQGLAWELGTGADRRLLLVRARAIGP